MTRLCATPGCGETIADRSRTGVCRACAQIEFHVRRIERAEDRGQFEDFNVHGDMSASDALRIYGVRV